jgi:hypothetical protein
MKLYQLFYIIPVLLFMQCTDTGNDESQRTVADTTTHKQEQPVPQRTDITYRLVDHKDSIKKMRSRYNAAEWYLIALVNRADTDHVAGLKSLIVPGDLTAERAQYFPFPFKVDGLKDVRKIAMFSYPAQAFAAYEYGRLIYTGPTNMGRKKDPTPTGLFFTNWKAEETKSTFNDEWELKWNFNIENKEGVGWHQYTMPGYPASHSCLRLTEGDAKYMYDWADQWVLKGTDNILAQGTPVVVFGSYPFGSPKPWLALAQDAHALDISEEQVMAEITPHMQQIMAAQAQQDSVSAKGGNKK